MGKNLFSIREAGRQGGRARGGSASLPADGSEVAEVPEVALALSAFLLMVTINNVIIW